MRVCLLWQFGRLLTMLGMIVPQTPATIFVCQYLPKVPYTFSAAV